MGAIFGNTIGLSAPERTCFVYDRRSYCQVVLQTDNLMFAVEAKTCGDNKVVSGDFVSSGALTSNWFGSDTGAPVLGWAWAAPGQVNHVVGSAASLYQNNIFTTPKIYKVTFTVLRVINPLIEIEGALSAYVGTQFLGTITKAGTYVFYAQANDDFLRFIPTTDFDGALDNISALEMQTQVMAFLTNIDTGVLVGTPNTLTFYNGLFYFNSPWSVFEATDADGCYAVCIADECGFRYDNIIDNGAFTGNANFWTVGTNWAYGTDNVCHTGVGAGLLSQDISPWLLAEKKYNINLTISGTTAGTLTVSLGGSATQVLSTNAAHNLTFNTPGVLTNTELRLQADFSFDGCVDDVQVIFSPNETAGFPLNYPRSFCGFCVSLETDTPECSILLSWTNNDAGFGLDYGNFLAPSTPLIANMRLRGYLRLPKYQEENENFLNSAGDLEILFFRAEKTKQLFIEEIPEYMCDALSIGKGHDVFEIDGEQFVCEPGFDPEFQETPETRLAKVKLMVRKKTVLMENKNC